MAGGGRGRVPDCLSLPAPHRASFRWGTGDVSMLQGPPDTAAAVAGLAREVEALRRALDQLRGLPGRVQEVADLVACLADAAAGQPAADTGGAAWSWINLPDASQPGRYAA